MGIDNRALRGSDEKCRLYRLYGSIASLEIVTRCLPAVEVGGIDGGVTGLVEQLRRESEQLPPDGHRCSIKGLAQRGWTNELAALEDERGSYAFRFFGPIKDFGECRVHMLTEKVQDGVLSAGNSVAGRIADLHQCCISKFSCNRDGLFDEAEENLLHEGSSSASSQSF